MMTSNAEMPVGGDHHQDAVGDAIGVAYFAAMHKTWQVGTEDGGLVVQSVSSMPRRAKMGSICSMK